MEENNLKNLLALYIRLEFSNKFIQNLPLSHVLTSLLMLRKIPDNYHRHGGLRENTEKQIISKIKNRQI